MTDRELLELAAKAAGMSLRWDSRGAYEVVEGIKGSSTVWNPLDYDGDALRLAVSLNFTVAVRFNEVEVFSEDGECLSSVPIFTASAFINQEDATKPMEATKQAIVRAAAEIGKQKE